VTKAFGPDVTVSVALIDKGVALGQLRRYVYVPGFLLLTSYAKPAIGFALVTHGLSFSVIVHPVSPPVVIKRASSTGIGADLLFGIYPEVHPMFIATETVHPFPFPLTISVSSIRFSPNFLIVNVSSEVGVTEL